MVALVETPLKPKLDEIAFFLTGFRALKEKYGIIFYQRKKNAQALLDLEITAKERIKILDSLLATDYYKGPRPDGVISGAEFWEFGKTVKGCEVYIKISLGKDDEPVKCYSFHPAERKIKYPYRPDSSTKCKE